MTSNPQYWTGPYGILVPMSVISVTATDGYNSLCQDGSETERFSRQKSPTREEYLKQNATFNPTDLSYYWKSPTVGTQYWTGPYDILVPMTIDSVTAADG